MKTSLSWHSHLNLGAWCGNVARRKSLKSSGGDVGRGICSAVFKLKRLAYHLGTNVKYHTEMLFALNSQWARDAFRASLSYNTSSSVLEGYSSSVRTIISVPLRWRSGWMRTISSRVDSETRSHWSSGKQADAFLPFYSYSSHWSLFTPVSFLLFTEGPFQLSSFQSNSLLEVSMSVVLSIH